MLLKQQLRQQLNSNKKTMLSKDSYLEHTYSIDIAPPSVYPNLLAKWMLDNVFKRAGKIADFGCGRGDYLDAFSELGFEVCGFDISPAAKKMSDHDVKQVDFESDPCPYTEEKYDFAFSKSVIEHLREPSSYLSSILESLDEGGKAVIMVPSWPHTYWGPFYIDHTHVTPYTYRSLKNAMEMTGFKNVKVEYFYQLPFLWKYSWLKPVVSLFSKIPLPYSPYNRVPWGTSVWFNKLIRFSKEVMIIAIAEK